MHVTTGRVMDGIIPTLLQLMLLVMYYEDFDGDSYGNALVTIQACTVPLGYVSDNTDCDDSNPSGDYTAIMRGVNNGTGVGLVGIDEIGP